MKKLLVIVYYWPPSGGAGVQRWLKFVKYLPQFGWMPTVITTKDGDYPVIDESLCEEVPAEIKVVRTKTPTFGKLYRKINGSNSKVPYGSLESNSKDSMIKKISLWFRLNLVIPDARILWNRYAFRAASKELLRDKYDAIITSGPPHSTHLVGLKLKKKFNINWIADFRDPWTKIDYLGKAKRHLVTEKLDERLESKVITKCNLVLSIEQKILTDLNSGNKCFILPNGFDPVDFKNQKIKKSKKHFDINYFGNITIERSPIPVLQAVNIFLKKHQNIRFNLWGNISEEVSLKLTELDTKGIVSMNNYIPHPEMLQKMVNSSLLLLIINNVPDNKRILPGKIYEYLRAQIPILGLGPQNGESATILQETESGKMFDYGNIDGIVNFIETKYNEWKKGKTFSPFKKIEKYSKINQTKQLAEILEKI